METVGQMESGQNKESHLRPAGIDAHLNLRRDASCVIQLRAIERIRARSNDDTMLKVGRSKRSSGSVHCNR